MIYLIIGKLAAWRLKSAVFVWLMVFSHMSLSAEPILTGADIAQKIYDREEGDAVSRNVAMELIDKRGNVRNRSASVNRRQLQDQKQTIIRFSSPASVRGMTFLTHDKLANAETDEQWLYMPATRKVRRIPASKRGDYFLGTDFTYNDVKDELKLDPNDYVYSLEEKFEEDGMVFYRLSGKPFSEAIGKELGYGGIEALVSEESWMPIDITFMDTDLKPLKKIHVSDLEEMNGIWAPLRIEVTNLQTGHGTIFSYSNIVYSSTLDDSIFSNRALKSGDSR